MTGHIDKRKKKSKKSNKNAPMFAYLTILLSITIYTGFNYLETGFIYLNFHQQLELKVH